MAGYGLVLKLGEATWPRIISGPLLTPNRRIKGQQLQQQQNKNRSKGPCDVFDPWVRWERGQVGISEFVRRRRRLEIWGAGNLGIWRSGDLEIWEFGDLGTWKSRN